jgi:hypothetical protein
MSSPEQNRKSQAKHRRKKADCVDVLGWVVENLKPDFPDELKVIAADAWAKWTKRQAALRESEKKNAAPGGTDG